jgi:CheY-like chemotaxis protein
MFDPKKGRVLVIDDNPAIHEDFTKIFSAGGNTNVELDATELALFGEMDAVATNADALPLFQIDTALQGLEGIELVKQARREHAPYAVAFIDIRMPPGLDGLETTARIWQEDADVQVVICTAYSDYSWSEMLAKLGRSDRLVVLKKPFDNIEVLQLANALTEKWRLTHAARVRANSFEQSNRSNSQELATIGRHAHTLLTTAELLAATIASEQREHAEAMLDNTRALIRLIEQLRTAD